MGEKCNTITLYASQADPVIEAIERNGVCYSKEAYVRKKYQESAKISQQPIPGLCVRWRNM